MSWNTFRTRSTRETSAGVCSKPAKPAARKKRAEQLSSNTGETQGALDERTSYSQLEDAGVTTGTFLHSQVATPSVGKAGKMAPAENTCPTKFKVRKDNKVPFYVDLIIPPCHKCCNSVNLLIFLTWSLDL